MRSRELHVHGVSHAGQPIPLAVLAGPLIVSSMVSGIDPATGSPPDDPELQVQLAFDHVGSLLEDAGTTFDAVTWMRFYVDDLALRDEINRQWLKHFPSEPRPARNVQVSGLGQGTSVRLEFQAWI